MKATKFFAMMLAALVSFTFVSCSDDDKEDEEVAFNNAELWYCFSADVGGRQLTELPAALLLL